MAKTLWTSLPVDVREHLVHHADEWILLALQRMRLGARYRVPKEGQMPADVQRKQARLRYRELQAQGIRPYRRRLQIIAHECQVHPNTIRNWLLTKPSAKIGTD